MSREDGGEYARSAAPQYGWNKQIARELGVDPNTGPALGAVRLLAATSAQATRARAGTVYAFHRAARSRA